MEALWEEPLETRDASDQVVSLSRQARRVVSLVPSITETLFALDDGKSLVGRTRYCIHPAPAVREIATIGGTKDIDTEAIIALKPDLVFANREENIAEEVQALRDAGLLVHVSEPRNPDDALTLVAYIGSAIGEIETAAAIVMLGEQILLEFKEASDEAKKANFMRFKPKQAPRVLAMIWRDPWMAAGGDTYISAMIETLGGVNLLAAKDRYPEVTLEEVRALAPDVVLLPSEPWKFGEEDKAELMAELASTPAVKEGRVHLCVGEDLMWFGSRTPGALRRLRPLLG